jgi:hypothetical protein
MVLPVLLFVSGPVPLDAQTVADPLFRSRVLAIGLAGGGAAFSDFQRAEALAGGAEFERRVSAQTTVALSATLTYWISRHWGVRAHGSFSPSRFVLRTTEVPLLLDEEPAMFARLGVFMADADVLFRVPVVFGRVAPYGIVGTGIVEYRADPGTRDPLPAEASESFDGGAQRRWAAVFGGGAVIPLERHSFYLTFELTNHLTRSPVDAPAAGPAENGTLILDPDGWRDDDDGAGLTSHVRLMVGVTLPMRF